MTEEKSTGIEKISSCSPTLSRLETSNRQQDWDSEPCIPLEPVPHLGRLRASSWDDSDDNSPPIPQMSGSKTCRIYTSDDKKPQLSIHSEINELKKQFFKTREKQEELEGNFLLERVREQLEDNCDRRLSPARLRRRSKSSGSSSPVPEIESQVSPTKINTSSGSDVEFQEASPQTFECDSAFYLNNFFTELRTKRISLMDPVSMLESISKEIPKYDSEIEVNSLDAKDLDGYFCKTSRKLSQILEVEESRRDSEKNSENNFDKSSEENMYNSNTFEKYYTQTEEISPFQTSRTKNSENVPEISEERTTEKEKYRSLSSEYLRNFQKIQKPSLGSLTERSARFFDKKLDEDFISLSAKTGRMQLISPKRFEDKDTETRIQLFYANTTEDADHNFAEQQEEERSFDQMESLKIDLTKKSENSTPRNSTDRSTRSHRTKSGKSRRSYQGESPKFMLNVGKDSERSVELEDENDFQIKDNSEECNFRKNISERSSERKTDRIPPIPLDSPSLESVISTRRSSKEQEALTGRSKSQNSSIISHRKKRKQKKSPSVGSDTKESSVTKEEETRSLLESYRSGEKTHKTSRTSKSSVKSIKNEVEQESEEVTRTPKSRSSKISKSPKASTPRTTESRLSVTPKTTESRFSGTPRITESRFSGTPRITESRFGSPRSSKSPDLSLKLSERLNSRNASSRSLKTADTARKDSNRPETGHSSRRQSEHGSSSRSKTAPSGNSSPLRLKITSRINSGSSKKSKGSLENRDEYVNFDNIGIATWKEKVYDTISNHSLVSSVSRSSFKGVEVTNQHSYRSDIFNPELDNSIAADNILKDQLSRSRNSSRTSVNSNITEADISPARSTIKSRANSCTSYPSGCPLDEKLDQISTKTNRSFVEEDEDCLPTHRSETGDESDRLSNKRLSVINEVSFEDLEMSQVSNEKEEKDSFGFSQQSMTSPGKISNEPEEEEWSKLIRKFSSKPNSLSLENYFPGFPQQKDVSWNSIDSSQNKMADSEHEENSQDIFFSRNQSPEKNASFEKSMEESLNSINLAHSDRFSDKPKQVEFPSSIQSSQNIYYMNLEAGGSFGIGEFGDVTCWNTDDSYIKDAEKPKAHGDGIPRQRTSEILPLKQENKLPEAQSDEDFTNYIPCRLKKSKSDNCIHRSIGEGSEYQNPTEILSNSCKYKFGDFPETSEHISNKVKNTSKSTINQNSSSESLQSPKDWDNLEFETERTPRLSRSLSDIDKRLKESMYQKEPSETLSIREHELFKTSPEVGKTGEESTNLSLYLARKAKEEKIKSSKWLKVTNSTKHAKIKLRKKGGNSSRGPFHDYLSSGRTNSSISTLKLRHPNCFQSFYKRFIGVFCLTSNSSAATSK